MDTLNMIKDDIISLYVRLNRENSQYTDKIDNCLWDDNKDKETKEKRITGTVYLHHIRDNIDRMIVLEDIILKLYYIANNRNEYYKLDDLLKEYKPIK